MYAVNCRSQRWFERAARRLLCRGHREGASPKCDCIKKTKSTIAVRNAFIRVLKGQDAVTASRTEQGEAVIWENDSPHLFG